MSALVVSLLGPLELQQENKPLALPAVRSAQALLSILAEERHPQGRDSLVELLWPGMPPQYGRKNLRQTLYELRKALPSAGSTAGGQPIPLVLADRQTIRLNSEAAFMVDTAEFEGLIRSGLPQKLEQAVALYRGDFLADFHLPDSSSFEEWVAGRRAAYEREVLNALERLAELTLSAGEYGKAEQFARHQLLLDDLREPAVGQLMKALAHQGQRSAALQAYGELRERLQSALNVDPAEETTDVFHQIQEETLVTPRAEEAVKRPGDTHRREESAAAPAQNLPASVTPFIGRTQELQEIESFLLSAGSRLLTLLGPGGIGKSRLALEVAHRLSDSRHFEDGIWFVPLAAVEAGEEIAPAIAAALPLDFRGSQEQERQLLDYLCDKKLLLLLDNMEQILVSGPPLLLGRILTRASEVRLLSTSRAPLHVQGEQLFRVSGLALPEAAQTSFPEKVGEWARQFDAVRLFESSALRVCPDFKLAEDNFAAVLAIGRTVEGFPLGLEMAAAWVELLSPDEIAAELAQSFDLLQAEWTPEADRHHSARAVFDWSWRLLSEQEQALCQVLSLFRGGFNREAALAVGQASLPILLNLKRKSWLQQSADDRYRMHELLRQYAEEKLRQDEDALQRELAAYAHYFVSYFERLAAAVRGPQQRAAFEAIERERDNARVTWGWLVEQRRYDDIARSLLPALLFYLSATGRLAETRSLIIGTRERLGREDWQGKFLTATLAFKAAECKLEYDYLGGEYFGEVTVPAALLRESWEILRQEPPGYTSGPWALYIATFFGWQQDRAAGLQQIRRLARHYADEGDRWLHAFALQSLGQVLLMRATLQATYSAETLAVERQEMTARFEQTLNLFIELGDIIEQARTLRWLGLLTEGEEPSRALTYFQQANRLLKEAGLSAVHYFGHLGNNLVSLGEYDKAFRIFAEAREYYERQGNRPMLTWAMTLESMLAARYGDLDHARTLREACTKIHEELGYEINVHYGAYEMGEIERIAGKKEAARRYYDQALHSFTVLEESHGQAFCRRGLGDLALREGACETAYNMYETALSLAKKPFIHSWLTCQTEIRLAQAALCSGNRDVASEHLNQANRLLGFRGAVDSKDLLMLALAEVAALMIAKNEHGRALALATFVAHHPASWHETRWRAEEIIAAASAALTPAQFSAAQADAKQLTLEQAQTWAGWE